MKREGKPEMASVAPSVATGEFGQATAVPGDTVAMQRLLRTELAPAPPDRRGVCVLALAVMSDIQVLDTASPARCEWVDQWATDPLWHSLQPMHRPYEALTHLALAAHVQTLRRNPVGPCSARPYDLALCLGDNIDNAQHNELAAFLAIVAGGRARLSAYGGVQDAASAELGPGPWPFWSPDAGVVDNYKPLGYPVVPDFLARASAEVRSPGLGFAFASVPGNHDLMRQGTALPEPAIEAIAIGDMKALHRPHGLAPADPLQHFVAHPAAFSTGGTRRVAPLVTRRAVNKREWIAAHVAHGAYGLDASSVQRDSADAVIDTEHVRIILLDTNHPAGDFQGSVGSTQLQWLDQRLAEVDREPGRLAVLASHHGAMSLTNRRGDDPQRHLADALTAVLHRHPCLAAWLVGHRHVHAIMPHPGRSGGFWEIATASLIDWPSQTRAVEILRHGSGQVEIVCTLMDHGADTGSLAHLHRQLAFLAAGTKAAHMQGQDCDADVRLMCR